MNNETLTIFYTVAITLCLTKNSKVHNVTMKIHFNIGEEE